MKDRIYDFNISFPIGLKIVKKDGENIFQGLYFECSVLDGVVVRKDYITGFYSLIRAIPLKGNELQLQEAYFLKIPDSIDKIIWDNVVRGDKQSFSEIKGYKIIK